MHVIPGEAFDNASVLHGILYSYGIVLSLVRYLVHVSKENLD